MKRSAIISKCQKYRYRLDRTWDSKRPNVVVVGLNPSIADSEIDDPTCRRCISFAKSWGFGSLTLINLFALRSSSPSLLTLDRDPIGPRNDYWIKKIVNRGDLVIVAWGNKGNILGRDRKVTAGIKRAHCFGLTKCGAPKHPLYLPAETKLRVYGKNGLT